MVHITGGGFYENIPRMLPPGCRAEIKKGSWPIPGIFLLIAEKGPVDEDEMFTAFNMGIGLMIAVASADKDKAMEILKENGETPMVIGRVIKGKRGVTLC